MSENMYQNNFHMQQLNNNHHEIIKYISITNHKNIVSGSNSHKSKEIIIIRSMFYYIFLSV